MLEDAAGPSPDRVAGLEGKRRYWTSWSAHICRERVVLAGMNSPGPVLVGRRRPPAAMQKRRFVTRPLRCERLSLAAPYGRLTPPAIRSPSLLRAGNSQR